MKMFFITEDIDTAVGMRLAGIESVTVNDRSDFSREIENACKMEDLAILIVSKNAAEECREQIHSIRMKQSLPLIVTLP